LVQEKVTLKKTIKNVFNSIFRKEAKLKYKIKEELDWTIIGKDLKLKTFEKMYNNYHVNYKFRFLKPIFYVALYIFTKINYLKLKKSFIKSGDLSREKCNRIQNAWNDAIKQTNKDSMLILTKDLKAYNNPQSKYWVRFTELINDIFMQTIYYDTFFRGFWEIFVINLTINMNNSFKDDKVHVLYNKKELNDIDYYMAMERNNGNYLVLQEDEEHIIVVPKGQALRLDKQQVKKIYDSIKEKENKK